MRVNEEIKSNFQLAASSIKNISLKNDFHILPESEELSFLADAEYDQISIEENETGGFIGSIDLTVTATAKVKKGKKKIVIKVCMNGIFVDSISNDRDSFLDLLTLNGCASLYAIIRSIVISLSAQAMSGGELILPMVNFFHMKEKKEQGK